MKKLLAIALAVLMLAVMLPTIALADTITALDFTQENAPTSGDHWTWDSTNKTLTLSGATITAQLILPGGATIYLTAGTANSVAALAEAEETAGYVICSDINGEAVKVKGTGSLLVEDKIDGIEGGSVAWVGNLEIGEESGATGPDITVIYNRETGAAMGGNLTIYSGKAHFAANEYNCAGLACNNVKVYGGELTVEGMQAGISESDAYVEVHGGTVKFITTGSPILEADETNISDFGACIHYGTLMVKGGTVWLIGSHIADEGHGVVLLESSPEIVEGMVVKGSARNNDENPIGEVMWSEIEYEEESHWIAKTGDASVKTLLITSPGMADGGEEEPIHIIVTTPTEPEKNPSTGANDMVAAAVALMAVSALGMAVLTRKK